MDEYIKFQNQTAGRDKFFRLVQYTSRIIWWDVERRKGNPGTVDRMQRLDQLLGLLRQMLRFGRFFETLHSALPLIGGSIRDGFVRVVVGMSRVANGCYMFLDHVICLHRIGLISPSSIDAPKWEKLSTRFWLYAILLSLLRDAHEWIKIYKAELRRRLPRYPKVPLGLGGEKEVKRGGWSGRVRRVGGVVANNPDLCIDSAKNLLDLTLPLNSLHWLELTPGSIGVIGMMSTILSSLPQFNPMLKMVPAS